MKIVAFFVTFNLSYVALGLIKTRYIFKNSTFDAYLLDFSNFKDRSFATRIYCGASCNIIPFCNAFSLQDGNCFYYEIFSVTSGKKYLALFIEEEKYARLEPGDKILITGLIKPMQCTVQWNVS